jgi:hypothetical protein
MRRRRLVSNRLYGADRFWRPESECLGIKELMDYPIRAA